MYTVNLCRCPYCGSYHYEVGYFTSGANCRCCDCGSLFWYNLESPNNRVISIPKESIKKPVDRNLSWEDELVELK